MTLLEMSNICQKLETISLVELLFFKRVSLNRKSQLVTPNLISC